MFGIHPDDLMEELGDGYRNEQQRYEASFRSWGWNAAEDQCKCHGSGYALSDLDQWHQCPYHGEGKRHPEQDDCDVDLPEVTDPPSVTAAVLAEMAPSAGDLDELPF